MITHTNKNACTSLLKITVQKIRKHTLAPCIIGDCWQLETMDTACMLQTSARVKG
jgi:hypothetical protein